MPEGDCEFMMLLLSRSPEVGRRQRSTRGEGPTLPGLAAAVKKQ
jgi:hypothetical protein